MPSYSPFLFTEWYEKAYMLTHVYPISPPLGIFFVMSRFEAKYEKPMSNVRVTTVTTDPAELSLFVGLADGRMMVIC